MTTVGWEWMWRRTKRLADLLDEPSILQGAIDLAEGLDRYCAMNGIPEHTIGLGEAKFIKGLQYVEYPLVRE